MWSGQSWAWADWTVTVLSSILVIRDLGYTDSVRFAGCMYQLCNGRKIAWLASQLSRPVSSASNFGQQRSGWVITDLQQNCCLGVASNALMHRCLLCNIVAIACIWQFAKSYGPNGFRAKLRIHCVSIHCVCMLRSAGLFCGVDAAVSFRLQTRLHHCN